MYLNGQFYFHIVTPFGLCSSTFACQRTTKSLAYILNKEEILVDVYIDDFYGAAETPGLANHSFGLFCMTWSISELGLHSSPDIICLGVRINTLSMIF